MLKTVLNILSRWVDAGGVDNPNQTTVAAASGEIEGTKRLKLTGSDWLRCVPFVFMHVACLSVIWVGWSWVAVGVAVSAYFLRMFAITGFYHRYFSHRSFETSRVMQFIFAVIGAASVQRGPLWWAAHHRYHHRHSDKENDVHSPVQHGFFWSHCVWFMSGKNFSTKTSLVKDLSKFPELVFLNRFDIVVPVVFAIGMCLLGALFDAFYPELGTSASQMLVWGFFISTVCLYHGTFTINSLAHRWGSKRFKVKDESRNNFFLALLTLGEGWHNNHHFYPVSARQGFYWWEIDITYYGLWLMSKLGLVWDLKPVPASIKNSNKKIACSQPKGPIGKSIALEWGEQS